MGEEVRTCGNCGHLFPAKIRKDKNGNPEPRPDYLYKGKCECNGKVMSGSLIAGCSYWRPR